MVGLGYTEGTIHVGPTAQRSISIGRTFKRPCTQMLPTSLTHGLSAGIFFYKYMQNWVQIPDHWFGGPSQTLFDQHWQWSKLPSCSPIVLLVMSGNQHLNTLETIMSVQAVRILQDIPGPIEDPHWGLGCRRAMSTFTQLSPLLFGPELQHFILAYAHVESMSGLEKWAMFWGQAQLLTI